MRNVGLACVFFLLELVALSAQEPEDFDPYEAERLADFLERPLQINTAGQVALEESGLMTEFQIASLMDYLSRHGDIMSLLELSAVDGFSPSYVKEIAPFISLKGGGISRETGHHKADNDIVVRSGWKNSSGSQGYSYGAKYRITSGKWSAAASMSKSAGTERILPESFSGYLMWTPSSIQLKLVAGNFNLRFGQGLALWNGMNMSGIYSPSAVMRNASSLSPSWSFSSGSSMLGVAGQIALGQFSMTAALASIHQNLLPAINLSYKFSNVHVSMTHYAQFEKGRIPDMKTAADMAMCIRGTDLFSEVSYDWVNNSVAALAGTIFPVSENIRAAVHLRYYPAAYDAGMSGALRSGSKCSNESSISLAGEYLSSDRRQNLTFSSDIAYNPVSKSDDGVSVQMKLLAVYDHCFNDLITLQVRVSERIRTWGSRYRTDIRSELDFTSGYLGISGRLNVLHCVGMSILGYLEGFYKKDSSAAYLRMGAFKADDWEDRIYVYERDAPGSFNVPAFYGRGIWLSMTGSYRFSRSLKMYLRGSWTSYPFMKEKKPGKAELKLQLSISF